MKSKPAHPSTLASRLLRIWWLRREGSWLLRSISRAKRHQRSGRDAAMRITLTKALPAIGAIQKSETAFARNWQALLRFQLAVFDIGGAEETSRRAAAARLPQAGETLELVAAILDATADWKDALGSARVSMFDGWKSPASGRRLIIFLPSTAMGLETRQQPGLRSGLRLVFGEIIATCREEGIAYEIRGRLANHGTPSDTGDCRYISHHTQSDREGGLHIKVTDLPSCFSFDERGYSGWSKFSQTPIAQLGLADVDLARAEAFVSAMRKRVISGNISKYEQSKSDTKLDLPEGYVFLGLQVIDDAVQALAHLPMLEMLAEVAATCRQQQIPLVVKRHPRCKSAKVSKALAKGDFQLSDASIHDLIARSCAVCVVNSSVGAEALLHGKPVFVFGEAEYQHACFRIREKGEFAKTFQRHQMPVSPDDLTRYLYLLRHRYAVDAGDPQPAREWIRRRVMQHAGRSAAE
jgi:hypothetical protein